MIAPGTSMELAGIKHRSDGPCYHCDEYGNEKDMTDNYNLKDDHNMKIGFTTFVRKPFVVEAVEITEENIKEVANYVGDLRHKEDGTPYILVDRRLVPNVERVYPGYFMTKMGENVRCYSRRIFREQFMVQTDQIKPWVDFMVNADSGV